MSETEKQDQQAPDTGSEGNDAPEAVGDDQLPEDLRPTDDNPLAQPLDPEDESTKDPEELDLQGGKPAEEWESDPDRDPSSDSDSDAESESDSDD